MTITLNALQKQRRDTASNWTSNNPTLLDGELGYETDTKKFKIGDGSTAWQSLDYLPIPDTNRLLAGNLTVGGNFQVNGTTTTIDTTTLTVEDKNIEIGKVSSPSDTTADGGGLTLLGSTNKTFNWVNSTDSWTSSEHLDLASGKVVKVAGTQILSATQYTGNSATTTALATARTISGVSFDGTQNITLNNNAITNGAGYLTDLVSDSSPQLGGDLDTNSHHILLDDSHAVKWGNSTELEILHTGSSGYATIHNAVGNLIIDTTGNFYVRNSAGSSTYMYASGNEVALYHTGSKKFETSSTGVKITGNDATGSENYGSISYKTASGTVRGFFNTTNDRFEFKDNFYSTYGNNQDLQIYHAGDHSYISDTGTGQLRIWSNDLRIQDTSGNSGIQMLEGGAVYLYHSGNQKFETTSTGATITPDLILNNASGDTALRWADGGTNKFSLYQSSGTLRFYDNTNSAERMRIDSSGRIGIGVTPSDFHANNTAVLQLKDGNSIFSRTGGQFLGFFQNIKYNSSDVSQYVANGLGSAYFQAAGEHKFYTVASGTANNNATLLESLRIDSSGRLGLGSSDPSAGRLVVTASSNGGFGGSLVLENSNNSDTDKVGIAFRPNGSATTAIGSYGESRIVSEYDSGSTNGANNLQFHTHAGHGTVGQRMKILSTGQIHVGPHSTPFTTATLLNIQRTNGSLFSMYHDGTDNNTCVLIKHQRASGSDMGTMIAFNNASGVTVGTIQSGASGTAYNISSDYRLKENVTAISDGITRLKTLKPSRFNFKINKDITVDGFLAHEVTAVPEAISGTKDGMKAETYYREGDTLPSGKVVGDVKTYSSTEPEYQGIDQSKLVPLLTAALQEAILKIEVLETKVAALEAA